MRNKPIINQNNNWRCYKFIPGQIKMSIICNDGLLVIEYNYVGVYVCKKGRQE